MDMISVCSSEWNVYWKFNEIFPNQNALPGDSRYGINQFLCLNVCMLFICLIKFKLFVNANQIVKIKLI